MKPRVLIIRTAGTNCDEETRFAFDLAGGIVDLKHINRVKENNDLLQYQVVCLPGGFSYGDDLGAGKIMSFELLSWLSDSLRAFIDSGGLMLGICNGFQVMVKTGILPYADFRQKVTLSKNSSGRFEDRWVYLKIRDGSKSSPIWFNGLSSTIELPVAHAEGRFCADKECLDLLESQGLVALTYSDINGFDASYPLNPNGSVRGVAGISDLSGRILGLMPHPERCIFKHHLPRGKGNDFSPEGIGVFKNAVKYFK